MTIRTLDFSKKGAFSGIFGRPRTLAWPVHAYRITIPARGKSGHEQLNAFERVILNLLGAVNGLEADALAKETCIHVDLVRNVIFRLRDRDLIDQDNRPNNSQHAAEREREREEQYVTALAFRELVGGGVLPFVKILDDGNALKTKAADEHGKLLLQSNQAKHLGPPSPREVIGTIGQMALRSGRAHTVPLHDQVRIGRDPEEYLLECEMVIQIHDADFRIANPLGEGFSRVLENAFARRLDEDQELQQWMLNWHGQLAAPKTEDSSRAQERAPFDTPESRLRYPKLVKLLNPSRGEPHRSLSSIYHSLEWAMFYTCASYDTDIALRRLRARAETTCA